MAISVEEALGLIYSHAKSLGTEIIPIENSLGRVLAEDITALYCLPPYDNSAMDGYAVSISDAGKTLKQSCTIFAGDKDEIRLVEEQCIRIMTGAKIPQGCEAIVPIEEVSVVNEQVTLPTSIKASAHIRLKGEDIQAGALLLTRGTLLYAHHITLLASQGITHVSLFQRPKVALFASGNELKMHYERIESHQLYNTNTPTFVARAEELGCDVLFSGTAEDTMESIQSHIKSTLNADFIITSGGVSVGDADFTKEAFRSLGLETLFESVEIKPGKPTTFGRIGNTLILNLPGNPLAAALCFELFAQSTILSLSGRNDKYINTISTVMGSPFTMKKGRRSLIPGWFNGESFTPSEKFAPGMVLPLSRANAFMMVDASVEGFEQGSSVKIIPTRWCMSSEVQKSLITF
ncbi:MAG: molybdopterin molybdotransferase MoeA [Sulfuricurvum sp.]|uniref:molybdopterin molybdotransferase MoeA n=1 Tax=Sulfuricurvum sp. TaxID=2025608 RepID=UPI00262A96C3|nr:gephyrin-like molybdotransferase Glp [Sulfuricurvum sp.]MDD2827979.1 molybdopterin molybdotransferase MoeA [Sulfuricurvum sp.]MDD4948144.1 molybdopterin molybdotransferase MoeA [Sulfuricurvum sp.]